MGLREAVGVLLDAIGVAAIEHDLDFEDMEVQIQRSQRR